MSKEAQNQVIQLQTKLQDTNRQLVQVNTQIQVKRRDMKISEIQLRELSEAGTDTPTYTSVGKMFLSVPYDEMISQLKLKNSSLQEDVTALTKKQTYLEKTFDETQGGLKEAVQTLIK